MVGLQKAKLTTEVFQTTLESKAQFTVFSKNLATTNYKIFYFQETALTTIEDFPIFSAAKIKTAASSFEVNIRHFMSLCKPQLISVHSYTIFPGGL